MSIFGRKPQPVALLSHPVLGALQWSPEEKGWVGSLRSFAFCLSHEGGSEPSAELLKYAESMLYSSTALHDSLQLEKSSWQAKYPNNVEEIEQLRYDQITFYRQKGKTWAFAMLGPETDDRVWRIKFQDHKCTGLGFDS
jgi:hypothetical protein